MYTPVRSIVTVALLAATGIAASRVAHGQITPQKDRPVHTAAFPIPESLRREHEEIHHRLEEATRAPGAVGEAARALAEVLHPHFVREEQIALPPLALLAPLARGETSAALREVLPMTDSLRAELPRMLEEHKAIRAATLRMGEAARTAGNADVAALADALVLHAQSEEELFYPAAIVVGDLVRARMAAPGGR